jgi:ABC-2 type transport system permease protein
VTSVFSLGLVLPLGLAIPVMQDPGSTFSTILTMIPFFTPMMMAIRIPLSMPSLAEIMVSLALLGGSVYFTMIMAGRVFSASVLLAGKRLSIREVGRLIRTG